MARHAHGPLRLVSRLLLIAAAGALAWLAPVSAQDGPGPTAAPADATAPAATTAGPRYIVPAFRRADHIAVLTVEGAIDGMTEKSLQRRIEEAVRNGATAIVLELDTPGGDAFATLEICSMLKDRSITPANTVAWVHPKAYSAGAIIALACREIVISDNGRIGDAAPIAALPGVGLIPLPASERAKMESPILAEVTDSARRNHYDEKLVQSFVSVGIELWLIENKSTGERAIVDRAEYETIFGQEPQETIAGITPNVVNESTPTLIPFIDPSFSSDGETARELTPEEIQAEIERQQSLPSLRRTFSDADRDDWQFVTQVISKDRLLTISYNEAIGLGLAAAVVNTDQDLIAFFGANPSLATLTRYDENWSEHLVRFLTSFWVQGLLWVIFFICLFVELSVPGVGVFGLTALIALGVALGAPFLAGMADWWEILLIVAGIVLVGVELFVIPGFGVTGVAGALCLLVGIVGTFVSADIGSPQGQDELLRGVGTVLVALMAAGVGVWALSRYTQRLPFFERLVLKAELAPSDHPMGASEGLLEAMGRPQRALSPGDAGTAETDLRPSGRAEIGGRLVDVKSISSYIAKGTPIRVVSVGRFVIEVEEAET